MKNNKLISIVLALLVCLSMVVSASATTESELNFALESSDSFVKPLDAAVVGEGETFTVSLNIDTNPGILFASVILNYDASVLELQEAEAAKGVVVNAMDGKLVVIMGDLRNAITAPSKAEPFTTTGSVVVLTFKVLAAEDKTTAIELAVDNENVVDINGDYTITANGAVLNVNAVAANHECDADNTIDANNGKEATCTEDGKISDLLCAHCAKVLTEGAVVPATDHNWGEGEITTEPGCETMGVRTYTCANCGETKVDDKIPATGHNYGEWKVTKEATVEAEGEETRTCPDCNGTEKRAIAKLAPVEKPEPKNNTGLIIAIVAIVLVGAGVGVFFFLKNKKK